MAFPRIGGVGIGLNLSNALGSAQQFGAQILTSTGFVQSQGSNAVTLGAGATFLIPAGTFLIAPGPYTSLQWFDPVTNAGLNTNTNLTSSVNGIWRTCNADSGQRPFFADSDGGNFRIANLTGCPIGATITNAGTSLPTPANGVSAIGSAATGLTVTASAGGSTWVPIVGGAINTTVTITAGGSYQYAPALVFSAPPPGGVQATGFCTLTTGAIGAVTVVNQGAGYVTAPTITLINDSRDAVGTGGILTVNATLVGANAVTAIYPVNHGTALANSTPTLSFAYAGTGSGVAATAIMNFVVTGWNAGTGTGFPASAQLWSTVSPGSAPTAAANTVNPIVGTGTNTAGTGGQTLGQPYCTAFRPATMYQITSAGGATQAFSTAGSIQDAGFGYPNISGAIQLLQPFGVTALPAQTATFGGITDTSWIQPI